MEIKILLNQVILGRFLFENYFHVLIVWGSNVAY